MPRVRPFWIGAQRITTRAEFSTADLLTDWPSLSPESGRIRSPGRPVLLVDVGALVFPCVVLVDVLTHDVGGTGETLLHLGRRLGVEEDHDA